MNGILENFHIELGKEAWKKWGSPTAMRDDITIVIGFLDNNDNKENDNNNSSMKDIKVKSGHIMI